MVVSLELTIPHGAIAIHKCQWCLAKLQLCTRAEKEDFYQGSEHQTNMERDYNPEETVYKPLSQLEDAINKCSTQDFVHFMVALSKINYQPIVDKPPLNPPKEQ